MCVFDSVGLKELLVCMDDWVTPCFTLCANLRTMLYFTVCMDDWVTLCFTLCANLRTMLYFRYVWMTVWHLVLLCVQIYVLCCILWCVRMIEWYFVFPGMQIYLQCLFYGMYGWLSDTLFYSVSKFTYYVVFYVRPDITVMVDWAQNIKLPTSHFMCSRKANFCFSSRQ